MIGIRVFKMLLAVVLLGLPSRAVGAGTFRFDHVEFESFKGGSTSVHALSNSGLAVGASGGIGVDSQTAFVSDQSGALQSIKGLELHHSIALVVNEGGQIAGRGCTNDDLCIDAAFRASPALGAQIITGLPGKIGEVTDINENGDVVGSWIPDPHEFSVRAFMFSDSGGLQELGHLGGGWSSASAANDLQQVVGASRYGALHGPLWTAAAGDLLLLACSRLLLFVSLFKYVGGVSSQGQQRQPSLLALGRFDFGAKSAILLGDLVSFASL